MQVRLGKSPGGQTVGFSLVEAMVGMAVFAICFFALYSGMTYCFSGLQFARENLRATQIMAEKLEVIRLYTLDQVDSTTFLPRTFTAYYTPSTAIILKKGVTAGAGIVYTGTVSVASAPITANYSDKLRLVTINLNWKTGNTPRQRSMQSFVTFGGLQSYVY